MTPASLAVKVLETSEQVGEYVAGKIAVGISEANRQGARYVIGCPSGRTPRSTLVALKSLVQKAELDLSKLVVVMMDDYVFEVSPGRYENVPIDVHFSCRKWAVTELRDALNSGLPEAKQIKAENVRCPDGSQLENFEKWIDEIGGIDLFILASGAGDGHVAFNGPGEPRASLTRIVKLAEQTRLDNLKTFPDFRDITEVPRFGASVGIATIADKSKSAVMILLGPAKREAFSKITSSTGYDENWPATIIAECPNALVVADQAAAS